MTTRADVPRDVPTWQEFLQKVRSDLVLRFQHVTLAQKLEQGTRIGIDPTVISASMSFTSSSVMSVDPCEQQLMPSRSKSHLESLSWSLSLQTPWTPYGVLSAHRDPKIQSLHWMSNTQVRMRVFIVTIFPNLY